MTSRKYAKAVKRYVERDDFRKLEKLLDKDRSLAKAALSRKKKQNGLHMAAKRGSADCLKVSSGVVHHECDKKFKIASCR